ncbi:hypothetical protein RBB50_006899 [Rhinocladiella similis]
MFTDNNTFGSQTPLLDPIKETRQHAELQSLTFDCTAGPFLPVTPNLLGELGDVQPWHGNIESWQWVVEQLQNCPGRFAKTAENVFIHRSMYCLQSPPAIRAAFKICTASQMVTPATKAMFTSSLEDEVNALLNDPRMKDLSEGLARLQAMVLYQILRFCFGDLKQKIAAEQQKGVTNAWALQLLQQMHTDLADSRTLEHLRLAESVRRTVTITFLFHALDSVFKYGVCTELPTLALIPIGIDSEIWDSSDVLCAVSAEGNLGTMKYGEWTSMWVACSPRPKLDAFQRMLMVACKGKAKVLELEAQQTSTT